MLIAQFGSRPTKIIYAEKISFVELIGFPTTGMAKKNRNRFINFLLSTDNKKHLISFTHTTNTIVLSDQIEARLSKYRKEEFETFIA